MDTSVSAIEKAKTTRMKLIVFGVGGLLVIFILWRTYKKIGKGIKNIGIKSQEKDLVKEAQKMTNKSQLSYPQTWFESASTRLFQAMSGTGTTEKTIYQVLGQLKTESDWFHLINTFGVKTGKGAVFGKFTGNLTSWLEKELSGNAMKKINDILMKIGGSI